MSRKRADPFYYSKEWRKARASCLRRDKYRCVNCGQSVRAKGAARIDHIRSRRQYPDLALFLPNLRTLCVACDNARSVDQRNRRTAVERPEIGPDGFPVGSEWSE